MHACVVRGVACSLSLSIPSSSGLSHRLPRQESHRRGRGRDQGIKKLGDGIKLLRQLLEDILKSGRLAETTVRKADGILADANIRPLVSLLITNITASEKGNGVPFQHIVWHQFEDSLMNMLREDRRGYRYNEETKLLAIVARNTASGNACMAQLFHGDSDGDFPNSFAYPTPRYLQQLATSLHRDPEWRSGISDKMIDFMLECLNRGRPSGLHYGTTNPVPVASSFDATDIKKGLKRNRSGLVVNQQSLGNVAHIFGVEQEQELYNTYKRLTLVVDEAVDHDKALTQAQVHEPKGFMTAKASVIEENVKKTIAAYNKRKADYAQRNKKLGKDKAAMGLQLTMLTSGRRDMDSAAKAQRAVERIIVMLDGELDAADLVELRDLVLDVFLELFIPASDYFVIFLHSLDGNYRRGGDLGIEDRRTWTRSAASAPS